MTERLPVEPTDSRRSWSQDLILASCFLTRLPLSRGSPVVSDAGALARATAWFPVVGAAIGATGGAMFLASAWLGLPALAAALAGLATMAVLTGALHEDGLADFSDGVGGGHDPASCLVIMRDSRIGTFGTLALVFAIGLQASCLATLDPGAAAASLVAAGALSRAPLAAVMLMLDPARPDGLAVYAGRPDESRVYAAFGAGLVIAWLTIGFGDTLLAAFAIAATTFAVCRTAVRAFGGHTGDVLGAIQQVAALLVIAIVAARA